MPETKAERIALDIINGNRGVARRALKTAKGKLIVLDVLCELTNKHGHTCAYAVGDLRSLLSV